MFKLQYTFSISLLLQASSLKIMFKFLPIFAILGIAAVLVRMIFRSITFYTENKSLCLIILIIMRIYDF